MPVKCVSQLLQRLFFGVSINEQTNGNAYSCKITVNNKHEFENRNKLSQMEAKNAASRKAVQQLCEVENKFIQPEIDDFPSGFASDILRYVSTWSNQLKCSDK